MAKAGDIVVVDFAGVQGIKRRPAIVVSSDEYHQWRPDMIIGLVTSQVDKAITPTDYLLQDWQTAGLSRRSAFRSFFYTAPRKSIIAIVGQVTDRDWQGISGCIRTAIVS